MDFKCGDCINFELTSKELGSGFCRLNPTEKVKDITKRNAINNCYFSDGNDGIDYLDLLFF